MTRETSGYMQDIPTVEPLYKDISFNQDTKHGPSYTETMDKTTPEMRISPLIIICPKGVQNRPCPIMLA